MHASMNDQSSSTPTTPTCARARAANVSIIPCGHLAGRRHPARAAAPGGPLRSHCRARAHSSTSPPWTWRTLRADVTAQDINRVLMKSLGGLQGILGYTEAPLVSIDFNHDPRSVVVDGSHPRRPQTPAPGAAVVRQRMGLSRTGCWIRREDGIRWIMRY